MKKFIIGLSTLMSFSAFSADLECYTKNFLHLNEENADSKVIVKQTNCRKEKTLSKNSQAIVKVCYSEDEISIRAITPKDGKEIVKVHVSSTSDFVTVHPRNIKTGFLWVLCKKVKE